MKYGSGFPDLRMQFLLMAIFLVWSQTGIAQYVRDGVASEEENPPSGLNLKDWKNRLVPGGNFGLGLGTQWYVDLSPSLGYQINERLVAGAGIIYVAYGDNTAGQKFSYQRYGAYLFGRYRLVERLFASTELETINVPDESLLDAKRVWIVNPLAGLSYIFPFGKRGGMIASLMYNLNYNPYLSPYPSPYVWRIGFFL